MFIVPYTRSTTEYGQPFARLLDESLIDRLFAQAEPRQRAQRSPALDVSEDAQSYTVTLDMPGVSKEAIKVAIEGRRVSVQAQTEAVADKTDKTDKTDTDRVVYSERKAARYARDFTLPAELDQSLSAAKLENGVLTLTLVKRAAHQAAQLTVN